MKTIVLPLAIGLVGLFMIALFVIPGCSCNTKAMAYRASVKSDLRNLVTAEESFHDSAGHYTADTMALGYSSTRGVSVEITPTPFGWSAVGRHELVVDGRCGVFDGRGSNPVRDTLPGEPVCEGKGFERRPSLRRRLLHF